MKVRRGALLIAALAPALLLAACVEGATPDCGPGSGCEPVVHPDAGADTSAPDAAADQATTDAAVVDARPIDAPSG